MEVEQGMMNNEIRRILFFIKNAWKKYYNILLIFLMSK